MTNANQKAAIRKRMAETGENYTTARRMVIEERKRLLAIQGIGTGLVSLSPPCPVPADGPVRDADG